MTNRGIFPNVLIALLLTAFGPANLSGQDPEVAPAPGSCLKTEETRHGPSLRNFLAELGANSVGLFSRDNLFPTVVGAIAISGTHSLDGRVRDYFASDDRFGNFEGTFGDQLGRAGVVFGVVGGLWTVSHFYGNDKFRRFSHDLAKASALTGLITFGFKHSVGRTRPNGSSTLSFPSGHSSAAFAAATIVDHHYGRVASVAAYATASFVAASRLDADKHFLSDVVAGAALGYVVGRTVARRQAQSRSITWNPIVSPSTRSVGIALSWQFGHQNDDPMLKVR